MKRLLPCIVLMASFAACESGDPSIGSMDIPPADTVGTADPGRDVRPWNDFGGQDTGPSDVVSVDGIDPGDLPDGSDDVPVPEGTLELRPNPVVFGIVMAGGSIQRDVVLRNPGSVPVTVLSVRIPENPGGAFTLIPIAGFGPMSTPPEPKTLGPGAQVILSLRFETPVEFAGREMFQGRLSVETDSTVVPVVDTELSAVAIGLRECDLALVPNPFESDLGSVPLGGAREASLRLLNTGEVTCSLRGVILRRCTGEGDAATSCRPQNGDSTVFSLIGLPQEIEAASQASVILRIAPAVGTAATPAGDVFARLSILHEVDGYGLSEPIRGHFPNDCDPGDTCPPNLKVKVLPQALRLEPDTLDLGNVVAGCASQAFQILARNIGSSPVTVSSVTLGPQCASSGEFALSDAPASSQVLAPGGTLAVRVAYQPANLGEDRCSLDFNISSPEGVIYSASLKGVASTDSVRTTTHKVQPSDLDVLLVLDTSGSMIDGFPRFLDALDVLAESLADHGRDFRLGVIGIVADEDCPWASELQGPVRIMDAASYGKVSDAITVLQGLSCDGLHMQESGLQAMLQALSPTRIDDTGIHCTPQSICPSPYRCVDGFCGGPNRGFLRPGAGLDVIVFSDEDDQSDGTIDEYASFLRNLRGSDWTGAFRLHAITGDSPNGCDGPADWAEAGVRYIETASRTGGNFASICASSLDHGMQEITVPPWKRDLEIRLGAVPSPGSLSVTRDGIPCDSGWTSAGNTNLVRMALSGACGPQPGSLYRVSYRVSCP